MKKSKLALYKKALKKEVIRRLGRMQGPEAYRRQGNFLIPYWCYCGITVKAAAFAIVKWYRSDLALWNSFYHNFKEATGELVINSPGGELDPADGIKPELRTQLDMQWQGRTVYTPSSIAIDPIATVAY
ncbi:hypothetical protein GO755_39030 [Spirosoma sp. HMF4905]|uniref:Uncharacterized protein n=1 Tax=Spirosoma arboris TaxID=2682092 RepID=A0A7K1SQV0_9BACT|nr:hypothetical protein [Spirosoma arboris]MVM36073.1 hypothetical protein [Spirosoma arboris]